MTSISRFMEEQFKHFNARETLDAAKAWRALLDRGGKMFLAMAGAMSTAELGIGLARMIREDKKITWGKLDANTPRFMINSDATIVAPLIFSYVLGR